MPAEGQQGLTRLEPSVLMSPLGPSSSAHGMSSVERNSRPSPIEVRSENTHGSLVRARCKLDTVQSADVYPRGKGHCGSSACTLEGYSAMTECGWLTQATPWVTVLNVTTLSKRSLRQRNPHYVIPSVGR